jgi:hypothetical protein
VTYPQYGPTGTGKCALTVLNQRTRLKREGCVTCIQGASGTDCGPWQTDSSKCTFPEDCGYGSDQTDKLPESALAFCVRKNPEFTFSDEITPYNTIPGEQIRRIISYNISFKYTSNPGNTIYYDSSPIPSNGLNVTFMKFSPYILITRPNNSGWYLNTNVLADYMQTNGYSNVFINVSDPDDNDRPKLDNIVFDGVDKTSELLPPNKTPTILSQCDELSRSCVTYFKWW